MNDKYLSLILKIIKKYTEFWEKYNKQLITRLWKHKLAER